MIKHHNQTMQIGPIDTLILFGGGELMVEFAKLARNRNIQPYLFCVKRHLEEKISKGSILTLKQMLINENITFYEEPDINRNKILKSIITEKTIGIGLGEAYTFKEKTISLFKRRLFDFMVIRLPKYRGGAHFSWQILRGDKVGCWNIQLINKEMIPAKFDSGAILIKKEYKIPQTAKIPQDYFDIANREAIKLYMKFINDLQNGKKFSLHTINNSNSLYLPRLYTLKNGYINWSWNNNEIYKFICAFDEPYAGASTFIQSKKVLIKDCTMIYTDGAFHPFISGLIYRKNPNSVFVATSNGGLAINTVLFENKNIINNLMLGSRFYTPHQYLDAALRFEAEYGNSGLKSKP